MTKRATTSRRRATSDVKKRRQSSVKRAVVPAKISVPQLIEVYRRERLFRVLDDAVQKRMVWVAAPAGAGKTSLVATYLETRELPALWYNVDARDADVANLFHYLAMAARLAAKRARAALPVFSSENQAGIGAFARGFFEALGAVRPKPSTIVIDDYHEARSDLLDSVLREALFALPRGVSAIVISRTEAPAWLASHFASGDVAAVGWNDLRLTPGEIEGLIRVYRPDWGGPQLKTVLPHIVELANGWAAALTLLLQTQRFAPVDSHGIEEFSERLFDYFATEILDKASPDEHDFLLKTSVVPKFDTALAARLTSNEESGNLLSKLERRSFLTQRLGTSGAYRYHPLLRGFLLRRAEATLGRTEVEALHRGAGEALVESSQFDEAMDQFQMSRDDDAMAKLLLRVAPSYIAKGRGRTIEAWIERFSPERLERDGWLLQWAAMSCLAYSPARSRELFERAHARFASTEDMAGLYGSCAGGIQAVFYEAATHAACDIWLERLDALARRGAECPAVLEPMLAMSMVMACIFRRPESPDNQAWAERLTTLAASSSDLVFRAFADGFLALRSVLYENMDRAEVFLERLRERTPASEAPGLSAITVVQSDAMCAWAGGDNETCIARVREGLAMASSTGVFVWNYHLAAIGVAAALTAEDFDAVNEFLALARGAAEEGKNNFAVGTYYFYMSWEAFLRGDQARAARFVECARANAEILGFPLSGSLSQFALAQILWKAERKNEARAALALARTGAEAGGYRLVLYGCDIVASDHEWDEDRDEALAYLRRGFKLAREGRYHNTFWLGKGTLTRAAVRALENGIEPEHVRETIAKHRLAPQCVPLSPRNWHFRYRLYALGSFELDVESDAVRSSTPKTSENRATPGLRGMPLRLLQAVLAFGARGVRDIELIDALWPDAEGDAGRRVFDTTLHRLRRQMGTDQILRLSDGRVYLDDRLCWVDVWALERALGEAEGGLTEEAPVSALENLARLLLGLYRGPLLADETSAWARGPRTQLAGKFRRTAERLGAALESAAPVEAGALYRRAFQGN